MLNDEINDILEKLDKYLTILKIKCIFSGNPYD